VNLLGGTRPGHAVCIPLSAKDGPACMTQIEPFLHDRLKPTKVLFKAALAQVQFETIQPFLDDNGRLGRPLITLIL
jgi:Fic family protein